MTDNMKQIHIRWRLESSRANAFKADLALHDVSVQDTMMMFTEAFSALPESAKQELVSRISADQNPKLTGQWLAQILAQAINNAGEEQK